MFSSCCPEPKTKGQQGWIQPQLWSQQLLLHLESSLAVVWLSWIHVETSNQRYFVPKSIWFLVEGFYLFSKWTWHMQSDHKKQSILELDEFELIGNSQSWFKLCPFAKDLNFSNDCQPGAFLSKEEPDWSSEVQAQQSCYQPYISNCHHVLCKCSSLNWVDGWSLTKCFYSFRQ